MAHWELRCTACVARVPAGWTAGVQAAGFDVRIVPSCTIQQLFSCVLPFSLDLSRAHFAHGAQCRAAIVALGMRFILTRYTIAAGLGLFEYMLLTEELSAELVWIMTAGDGAR